MGEQKTKISQHGRTSRGAGRREKNKKESSEEIEKITKGTIFEGIENEQNQL